MVRAERLHRAWRPQLLAIALIVSLLPVAAALGRHRAGAVALPPNGWSQGQDFPGAFAPRWDWSTAYMAGATNQIVVFGGSPKDFMGTWYADTWLYDGSAWTQGPTAPAGLTARGGSAMAYYPKIGKMVLFGGAGATWPPFNDTWYFDGSSWTKGPAAPTGLTGRSGAEMVYDPDLNQLVLFGGSGTAPDAETWLFNGTKWTQGPAAPPAMGPRVFFGMDYDAALHRVVVAGGDGASDVWYFDGTSWTSGPALPDSLGPRERVRMDYDPDIGATLLYGGIGPSAARSDMWMLKGGVWSKVPGSASNPGTPGARLDAPVVWDPALDSVVVFGGVKDGNQGQDGLTDTWYFRDTAPQVGSVAITPTSPAPAVMETLTVGATSGGYSSWTYEYAWYIDGVKVPGATSKTYTPATLPGDTIQAQVRVTDALGVAGPWIGSNLETVSSHAALNGATGSPGQTASISGSGFLAGEVVDVHLDSVTGPLAYRVTTTSRGSFPNTPATLPSPYVGGAHPVYGVGETSGMVGTGSITVVPVASIAPVSLAAGDTTAFTGLGYRPGESVSVSFPGGTPVQTVADQNGTAAATLASPPEPAAGGQVTGAGASGSASSAFKSLARLSLPDTGEPGDLVPATLTGFGAGEKVNFDIDAGPPVATGTADAAGSLSMNVPMSTTWQSHTVDATGVASGASDSETITLAAWMSVSPSAGAVGTLVTITSGPGWIPGETVHVKFQSATVKDVQANSAGVVNTTYAIPQHGLGPVYLRLQDDAMGVQPNQLFTVTDGSNHAPTIAAATITPSPTADAAATLTATATGVSDPDGDQVTLHYAWTVDGLNVSGNDTPSLTPSHFTGGDQVGVTITATDPGGLSANATAAPVTIVWSISPGAGAPGGSVSVSGQGFGASETVDIHLDSSSGTTLRSVATDATGAFAVTAITLPAPLPGGNHVLYGIGRTSGRVGTGPLTVSPVASLTPSALTAGDVTTFTGQGFRSGDTVWISFPGQVPASYPADANGTVAVSLTSPPEPSPGGVVTATGASGVATAPFTVSPGWTIPSGLMPGDVAPVTLSGFGASESVDLGLDGSVIQTFLTAANGSASGSVTIDTVFGDHTITATGRTSGVTLSTDLSMDAWLDVSPTKGPVGTVVTIDSGPGWIAATPIDVKLNGDVVQTGTTDATGAFATTYTIPDDATGTPGIRLQQDGMGAIQPKVKFTVTAGGDTPPSIGSVDIGPTPAYASSPLTANVTGVSDPDGGEVSLDYAWSVGGHVVVGVDAPTLTADHFDGGEQVTVEVTATDSAGLSTSLTSAPATVQWNLLAGSATPGAKLSVSGAGFSSGERVDVHLDSAGGQILRSIATDANGSFPTKTITLPSPLAGGRHMLYGVGRKSHLAGPGPFTVLPSATIDPTEVGAGDLTTYQGNGFVPGETVGVSFPAGSAWIALADANGAVSVTLPSPAEPDGGGVVTGAAPSGSASAVFTVQARLNVQPSAHPYDIVPFTATGFGAGETVRLSLDGGPTLQSFVADPSGSVSGNVTLSTTWGTPDLVATGSVSGVVASDAIDLSAWMTVSPTKGRVGTVVTVISGPGWVPNEVVHLKWEATVVKDVTADALGRVVVTYTIPQHGTGDVSLRLTDDTLGVTTKVTFTVTG